MKKDVKEAVKWLRSGWRKNPFARFIPSERRKADIADLLLQLSAELENVTQRKTRTEETSVNPEKVTPDDTVKPITTYVCFGGKAYSVARYVYGGGGGGSYNTKY